MNRIKKIVSLVVFVPLAIILIVLCVANRQSVTLALNPFQPSDEVLSLSGPFFVFLFLALLAGMLIGSAATWLAQAKYRKQARTEARAALQWQKDGARPDAKRSSDTNALVPAAKA